MNLLDISRVRVERDAVRRPPVSATVSATSSAMASRASEAEVGRPTWRWARLLGGAAILAVVLARLGGAPVVDALRATDGRALALGTVVGLVTTACAALRWQLVARRLHVDLALTSAVAACYRSQFLNVTLPGGVLGDIDRGVHHGRGAGDLGRGLRAVAWERAAGQAVLATVAGAALLVSSPAWAPAPHVPSGLVIAVVIVLLLVVPAVVVGARRAARSGSTGLGARAARTAAGDARGLAHAASLTGIISASLVVVAGHVATFALAARTVGVGMPLGELAPLALVVLLAAAVPLNVAGWGPREGAAAWVFAAAGTSAGQGLSVAVAYGAIVFVATLPGAVLVLVGRSAAPDPATQRG